MLAEAIEINLESPDIMFMVLWSLEVPWPIPPTGSSDPEKTNIGISFFLYVVILVFMFVSLKLLFPFTSKEKYFSEYAFSYTRAQITKKLNLDGNILDVEQTRRTLFYPNNFFSAGREIGFFTTKGEKQQFLKQ